MCNVHFGGHLLTPGAHSFDKVIQISKEDSELLLGKLSAKSAKIDEAISVVLEKSKITIKMIENSTKSIIKELEDLNSKLYCFMGFSELFSFQESQIEKLLLNTVSIKNFLLKPDEICILQGNYGLDPSFLELLEQPPVQYIPNYPQNSYIGYTSFDPPKKNRKKKRKNFNQDMDFFYPKKNRKNKYKYF